MKPRSAGDFKRYASIHAHLERMPKEIYFHISWYG
jgi:hypothetical protein